MAKTESEKLEAVDRAAKAIPVAEDIHLGGDEPEVAPEPEDERDAEIQQLKNLVSKMQEDVAKLVAKGAISAEQAAEQLNEHEIEAARRKIYARIKKNGNKVRIVVHSHHDVTQNRPVPLGLNGSLRYLERGKPVIVSAQELEVLDHAEYNHEEKLVDPNGNVTMVKSRRQSYPYQIIDHHIVEAA